MRVLQVFPGALLAGLERQVVALCDGLRQSGVDVRAALWHDAAPARSIRQSGVPTLILPQRLHGAVASAFLREYIQNERIEIVHSHGYKANVVCWLASRGLPVKRVRTEHGMPEPFRGWAAFKMALYLALDTIAKAQTDHIIYVSNNLRGRLSAKRLTDRSSVLYNVNANDGEPLTRDEARSRLGINRNQFVVGGAGRLVPVKDFSLFIEVAARLKNQARFIVFGDGPLRNKLLRQNAQAGSPVDFVGQNDEFPRIVSALDILLITSLDEGLPTVLLEAMAAGVAIVSPRVGGVPEVLTGTLATGMTESRSPAVLAEACTQLLKDRKRRNDLAEAGQIRSKDFTVECLGQAAHRLYEELLS